MPSSLFSPFHLRDVTLKNRVVISPMTVYAANDGMANDWHLVHYGKLAQGGPGMVMVETAAVEGRGRGTYGDLGLWRDDQIEPLKRVATFIRSQGCVPAIQVGHSGRKGSLQRPWEGYGQLSPVESARGESPWQTVAPSAVPAAEGWPTPVAMGGQELEVVAQAFEDAARRAALAEFDVLELHCAHGYLLHEFLSPLSNLREDKYGGSVTGRMAYPLEVARRVRAAWPQGKPLLCRVSAVDGANGGYELKDTVAFAKALHALGVDLVDCSSGGIAGFATAANRLPRGFGHQVEYATAIREEAMIPTMAVGLIVEPAQANSIVRDGKADLVGIGREALINPNWTWRAQQNLDGPNFSEWQPAYGWWLEKRERTISAMLEAGQRP